MNSRCKFHGSRRPVSARIGRVAVSCIQILSELVLVLVLPREIEDRDAHAVHVTKVPRVQRDEFGDDVFQD